MTGLTLVVWTYLMRQSWAANESVLDRLTALSYPIGDVLLLAMLARSIIAPGARTASYRLLVGSLTALLTVDIVYMYVETTGVYEGGLIDLGWLLSYLLCATAALHPSMRSLSEVAPAGSPRGPATRLRSGSSPAPTPRSTRRRTPAGHG